ncbi:hypothetical protein ASU31_00425 [Pedobacter ginsenosidimutans]|uniref:Outer membrane protein beta-barrel domain-containing protein n=1 Tax=Pedobacter ginsenosidimutans TaxID=687842 RepID=A0A0T5VVA2_9SPHI|nr:hypothetical protein [Pedobacter ginsenosidimutans]KRT17799.1 hypothetical protein ASU31_00425 [Pedobacter ginsenosidimutans]
MKKTICLLLQIVAFGVVAQEKVQKSFIKAELGLATSSTKKVIGTGYSFGQIGPNIRFRGMYGYNLSNQFSAAIGAEFSLIRKSLDYNSSKDAKMVPVFVQLQYNFKQDDPKTFFLYSGYGLSPKMGSKIFGGQIFDAGLGWQYQPKLFNGNPVSFMAGYHMSSIKDVRVRHYGSFGGNEFDYFADEKIKLSSIGISIGLSF